MNDSRSKTYDLLCILGPTATGKTRLAVAAARQLGGEIISADSRQVYRGMDIGTGKDRDDYTRGGRTAPYHLIDIAEPGTEFNIFSFQRAFLEAYHSIRAAGRTPIVCGGSGLYLDAVLRGYQLSPAPRNETLRAELANESDEQLKARLASLKRLHNVTDTCNRERLLRALEIALQTPAAAETVFPRLAARVYGLRMTREKLRERIAERLRRRLEQQGMVAEVESLLQRGISAARLQSYGLEYRFVTGYVTGALSYEEMFRQLKVAITDFAKRQERWFRWMERQGVAIVWLEAEQPLEQQLGALLRDLRNASRS